MRVTQNILAENILSNITGQMSRVYDLQTQLSSGKKFNKPSDDPVNLSRFLRLRSLMNKDEQYKKNISTMKPAMEETDALLFDLSEVINEANVVAKEYMNSGTSSGNQEILASQMEGIFDQMMRLANSSNEGKYLLGGYNSGEPPFELSGGKILFNGTDDYLTAEIGEGDNIQVSMRGSDIFSTHRIIATNYMTTADSEISPEPSTNQFTITINGFTTNITVGTGTSGLTLDDVVESINSSGVQARAYAVETDEGVRLKITSKIVGDAGKITVADNVAGGILEELGMVDATNTFIGSENDTNTGLLDTVYNLYTKMSAGDYNLSDEFEGLGVSRDNVLMAHGKMGILMQNMDNRDQLMTDMWVVRQELLSGIQDIDYAETMMNFNKEMTSYQSAIQVGARVMMPSLLDYLR